MHSFTHGEIKHLAVERCVIAGGAPKANHLAIGKGVFASTARRKNHLGRDDVDDVQSHLGICDLCFSAAKKTEQLSIADILAAKLGNVTRDADVPPTNSLPPTFELPSPLGFPYLLPL